MYEELNINKIKVQKRKFWYIYFKLGTTQLVNDVQRVVDEQLCIDLTT